MDPIIKSGQRIQIEPVDPDRLEAGDVVVVRVDGETMVHQIRTIDRERRLFEIAGTSGAVDGWARSECVYAICTAVDGRPVPGASPKSRLR